MNACRAPSVAPRPAVRPTPRCIGARLLGVLLVVVGAACGPTTVSVSSAAPDVHSEKSTQVTARVMKGGNPAAGTVTLTSDPNGSLPPGAVTIDPAGDAIGTFTGGVVTTSTPVTVTATHAGSGASGTATITVHPLVGADDFGPDTAYMGNEATAEIFPKTTSLNPLTYVYEIKLTNRSSTSRTIDVVNVRFMAAALSVTATNSAGLTPRVQQAGGPTTWLITLAPGTATDLTVTAKFDRSPGGTANFDVVHRQGTPPSVTAVHANIAVVGPT